MTRGNPLGSLRGFQPRRVSGPSKNPRTPEPEACQEIQTTCPSEVKAPRHAPFQAKLPIPMQSDILTFGQRFKGDELERLGVVTAAVEGEEAVRDRARALAVEVGLRFSQLDCQGLVCLRC